MGEQDQKPAARCSFCGREQDGYVRLLQSSEAAICNHCVLFAYQVFDAEGQLPVASLHESPSRMDDENDELAVTSTRLRKVPDK